MSSIYNLLVMPEADALHSVMNKFKLDARNNKIDLGVGVYRDSAGNSPVMEAIKSAERSLYEEENSKKYLGLEGVVSFIEGMSHLLYPQGIDERISAIQTVGGTGGLRLAIEITAQSNPGLTVYIGTPTWPNHIGICDALSVKTSTYPYLKEDRLSVNYHRIVETIISASPGDIIVLHGPCHNPTGMDMTHEQFLNIMNVASEYGVVPLIDAAYYGMGTELSNDLVLLGEALSVCQEAFLVMSCSKAFGLYRERVGILFSATANNKTRNLVQASLEKLARNNYSMPPAHGAHAVAKVLSNEKLLNSWKCELNDMRERVVRIREELSFQGKGNPVFVNIVQQKGIFSLLSIGHSVVEKMAKEHAIYMPSSGRINLAGFKDGDIELFIDALNQVAETS